LRHLQSDPYELGDLRRLLNFGHCIGHAVEAEVGFSWLHGECVAVGIAVACRVGARAGVTPTATSKRIHSLLKALDLPTHVPTNRVSDIWGHLRRIERVRDGHLHLVVPTQIGSVTILPDWPAGVAWSDVA
jgi:3-dehydroquinate synthase